MASKDYLIFHPLRAKVWDLLCLVFSSKSLAGYAHLVETNNPNLLPRMHLRTRFFLLIFLLFSIITSPISKVAYKLLKLLAYFLNMLYLNGGFIRLVWNTIKGSRRRRPDQQAAYYKSAQSFASGNIEYGKNYAPVLNRLDSSHQVSSVMEIAALASSLAYENRARIKDIVNNDFNMNFVEFYKCWNVFVKRYTTKAFICCSKEEDDAELIVVAFRGTDGLPDWRCNLNFSFITLGDMGKVHLGFMTALGLQDKHDTEKGFPKEYNGDELLAYYSIKKELSELVTKHKNAKILVTGHSLGGALAVLFTSLLVMHEEKEILDRISWVMTFGQPRVGDATFGNTMVSVLGERYTRMVYRHDIVPRIPFQIPVIHFKHSGTCISYSNWFHGKKVKEVENKNYFNIRYIVVKFWGAIVDFFLAIWEWEGFTSTLARFIWIIFPGVAFHNTKNYVNATRKAKVIY